MEEEAADHSADAPLALEGRKEAGSPAALLGCSEAICSALRQLQEAYAAAQARVQELQVEKASLKADARRMAEHLFGELSSSQEHMAALQAEVERLAALQGELAEAAAAEAEAGHAGLQAATARAEAANVELQVARAAAHRAELALQDERARSLVAWEGLACESDKLQARLVAAEARTATARREAELWLRKHKQLEEQVGELQAELQEEQRVRQGMQRELSAAREQAEQARAEAEALRTAAAVSMEGLGELCAALQTAQAAMAADSSSNPAYLRALTLMEASLLRVVAASEAVLGSGPAQWPEQGVHAVAGAHGDAALTRRGSAGLRQLQQHVESLLLPQPPGFVGERPGGALPGAAAGRGANPRPAAPAGAAAQVAPDASPLQPEQLQRPLEPGPSEGGGTRDKAASGARPALPASQPAPKGAGTATLCQPQARALGAEAAQQASSFIQAFRAQHGRPSAPPSLPGDALPAAEDRSGSSPLLRPELGAMPAASCSRDASPPARPARHGGGTRAEGSPPLHKSPSKQGFPAPAAVATAVGGGDAVQSTAGLPLPPTAVPVPALLPGDRLPRHWAGGSIVAAPLGGTKTTRDSLTAVIMAVEDELATLDLRHAALLKQSARLREDQGRVLPGDITAELEREEVAGVVRSVREAMQRKGEQLAQLKRYREMLALPGAPGR